MEENKQKHVTNWDLIRGQLLQTVQLQKDPNCCLDTINTLALIELAEKSDRIVAALEFIANQMSRR